MPFKDAISQIAWPEGFDATPIIAKLTEEYDSDLTVPQAKIDTITAERDKLAQENTVVKARNYDLIVKNGASNDNDNKPADSDPEDVDIFGGNE